MSKLIFLLLGLALPQVAYSETVTCKTTGKSKIKSVKLVRVEHDYQPQWLEGEVELKDGLFKTKERVVVADAPRGLNLNYVDSEYSDQLWLELGPYHGTGVYSNAKLTYVYKRGRPSNSQGDSQNLTADMSCTLSGTMNFKNYCEKTGGNNPEKNLLDGSKNQDVGLVLGTLACGVDVNVKDERGCTPILLTADRDCGTGKFDIFSGGAYSDKIILALLDNGAIAEDLDPVTMETPLHKLTRHQDLKTISSLVLLEADIDAQDSEGYTPLMRAVETGSDLVVDSIVSGNANLNLKNKNNQTAVDIAKQKKFDWLLEYLVEATHLEVVGTDDGQCAPLDFQLQASKAAKITLKTVGNKMFMLSSNKLNLSLMVNGNSSKSQRLPALEPGEYPINCGVHGGQQHQGKIKVTEE